MQFSPDGTNIVSASGDKTVRVWSVATGSVRRHWRGTAVGILRSLARMARISYRRVGTRLCARVGERGDRGVCADIGGGTAV